MWWRQANHKIVMKHVCVIHGAYEVIVVAFMNTEKYIFDIIFNGILIHIP